MFRDGEIHAARRVREHRKFLYAVEAAEEFLVVDKLKLAQPNAQMANTPALASS